MDAFFSHKRNSSALTAKPQASELIVPGLSPKRQKVQADLPKPPSWDELAPTLAWMKQKEVSYVPKSYLKWQPFISADMRGTLLRWLMEVCEEFELQRETFHMAVNYVDRFLSVVPKVPARKLQLIGTAALLIACKLEEMKWPSVHDLVALCDGACTLEELLDVETSIIQALEWWLMPATPVSFLKSFLLVDLQMSRPSHLPLSQLSLTRGQNQADSLPYKQYVHLMWIVDMATLSIGSVNFPSSLIVASAMRASGMHTAEQVLQITGHSLLEMGACLAWIEPFANLPRPKALTMPIESKTNEFHNLQLSYSETCPLR